MEFLFKYHSPIGELTVASDGVHITGLWIKHQRYFPPLSDAEKVRIGDIPVMDQTKLWLDRYFAGDPPALQEIPLNPKGTVFQNIVWQLLIQIPYGNTTTYKALAAQAAKILGKERMSAQAVGNAVGRNPVSILIPCHRVLGSNGSMTGYAGGIEKKKWLLEHEAFKKKC